MSNEHTLSQSGKRFGAAALGLLHDHVELFSIELQEQKERSSQLLLLIGFALISGLLLIVGLSTWVVIAFWDTHRYWAIGGVCLLYFVIFAASLLRLRNTLKSEHTPFESSLAELKRAREQLLP
ncbi:phage holin family protein [Thiopseudomonas alkaliphila]|uniref:phage holin family protein n=1 Tax=Thiopseudomonas alkaliphila TaxID=1697053 RepID=UPI002575201A|nr:phage holin family protein [Thiopseudomonas alkaliphila]MDM1707706.1 phage holin family protein [Thiopseudomonas alkaliphila]